MINLNDTNVQLYADDTVIYNSREQIIQMGLNCKQHLIIVCDWCNRNRLTVNIDTTKIMTFGSRKCIKQRVFPSVRMGNRLLDNVQTFKYLGVILDRELKFNAQAQNVYKLASHKVNSLRKVRPYVNEPTA